MLSVDDRRELFTVPSPFNMAHHVLWSNNASPEKIALAVLKRSGSERRSYGRLRDDVLAMAGTLKAAGLRPGDRLLLRLGNTPDFPIAFLGAIAAGIVPAPTSAALGADEIARIAQVLAPAAVLAAPGIAVPDESRILSIADLRTASPPDALHPAKPDDPAYIVFTSGTSRNPMGVVHAHRSILARRFMFDGWYGLGPDDRVLHAGAFNWTFTLGAGLMDPWTVGATALIPEQGIGADLLALLLARHQATLFAGAPGVFRQILRHAPLKLTALRHGLTAGEKLPESLRVLWQAETGTDLHEAFGQSECSTFISGAPSRPAPPGTLGYTQPGRAVAILGTDGPVPRGQPGDIAVHRSDPGLMLGYLGQTETPADEWWRTGDQGVMQTDGAIAYVGRDDDILTAGGFRVSPLEIEDAMLSFPGLAEAAAVDHRVTPDTTIVALHYAATTRLDETELARHAARHLARHKQPRLFVQHASLPRNPNGKLLRRLLRPANETTS